MEAPTPASALIHSSTLVIMGVYLVIRMGLLFEFTYFANLLLMFIGGLTIAIGAISASFQNDIKKLVAYSTVSQMGYLFCGCGFLAYPEVLYYLAVHALNKAFLFIIVGYIVHFFNGNTDLRFMGSLFSYSPGLSFLLIVISLNLTGLPLTSGFVAKEFLVFQTLRGDTFSTIVRVFWFVSFFFTSFYMLLLNWAVFFKAKQGFVKMYNYNTPEVSLSNPVRFEPVLTQSHLLSKLSVLFFMLLLTFILLVGESLLGSVFGVISAAEGLTSNAFFTYNYFFLLSQTSFSSTVADYLSFLVFLFFLSTLRYLRNIA